MLEHLLGTSWKFPLMWALRDETTSLVGEAVHTKPFGKKLWFVEETWEETIVEKAQEVSWRKMAGEGFCMNSGTQLQGWEVSRKLRFINRVAMWLELCSKKTTIVKVLWIDFREVSKALWTECRLNSCKANSYYTVMDGNQNWSCSNWIKGSCLKDITEVKSIGHDN